MRLNIGCGVASIVPTHNAIPSPPTASDSRKSRASHCTSNLNHCTAQHLSASTTEIDKASNIPNNHHPIQPSHVVSTASLRYTSLPIFHLPRLRLQLLLPTNLSATSRPAVHCPCSQQKTPPSYRTPFFDRLSATTSPFRAESPVSVDRRTDYTHV